MGNLPEVRIQMCRPFTNTGVDYAGPIEVLTRRARGKRLSTKGYIAVFICMSTKAVHLEIVSDMTTSTFLAAFARFTGRRGFPGKMFSDCGTTFVGADNQMKADIKNLMKQLPSAVTELYSLKGTEWHFIPPASPHFGGLREAGMKSTKHHLKRVLGKSVLTFEELQTVLVEIEACLNSRPLCEMTADPDDLEALTPGHFILGQAPLTYPRPNTVDLKVHRLDRWQLVQRLNEHFWKRWQTEYFARLQRRPKWLIKEKDLKVGELVLIKDERLPPARWSLGRIEKLHYGEDNVARVAAVRTSENTVVRPITKLCPLPIDHEK